MRNFIYFVVILTAVCCGIAFAQAQEPPSVSELPDTDRASWIVKITTAIQDGSEAILTTDEAKALVNAYASLEQRQAADIAVSETRIYVLSPTGAVLLSKALP